MFSLWDGDHPLAGQIVQQAMARAAQPDRRRERSLHQVAQVYYIGVEFGWTDIDLFVDISDQVARRIEAEALYETQGHGPQFSRKRIESFAGYHGWFGRTGVRRAVHQAERADQRLPDRNRQRSQEGAADRQGESRPDGAVRQRRFVGIRLGLGWMTASRIFPRCWSCLPSCGVRGWYGPFFSVEGGQHLDRKPLRSKSFEVVGMIP